MRKRWFWIGVAAAASVLAAVVLTQRVAVVNWVRERQYREALPSAQPAVEFQQPVVTPSLGVALEETPGPRLASDVNLAVPFAPQAPFANWDQPYQDACEEAAIIMVERYLKGTGLTLEEMDREILRMVDFQNEHFGFYRDSNAAETARLAEAFYPHLSVSVRYDVTADDIKAELAEGRAVVVLVNGRRLGNPFYTQPGPERHTLVIKGFKSDKFITNDPGTKRGADFVYQSTTVMNAIEDYDGNTPGTYQRAMIVLTSRGG